MVLLLQESIHYSPPILHHKWGQFLDQDEGELGSNLLHRADRNLLPTLPTEVFVLPHMFASFFSEHDMLGRMAESVSQFSQTLTRRRLHHIPSAPPSINSERVCEELQELVCELVVSRPRSLSLASALEMRCAFPAI